MAYVKSKNIKMYPSGYRGLLNNGIKKSYNPESKLNVESNAIRSLKTLLTYGKGDFVITENYSWNEAADHSSTYNYFNFEFICGGYYFKIIDSYDAFKDLLSQTGVTALYAAISFAYMNVFIPESKTDSVTTDVDNIYITDPHLRNQKPGESAGEEITPSNLNDDASNIIDFSSLDQGDEFTGVSLSTTNDDTKLHYFKILEKNATGNFVVPQEAKLITDTKHILGSTSNNKNKSLYDEYETGKIKSHNNSSLDIEANKSVNVTADESVNVNAKDSINVTTPEILYVTTPRMQIQNSDLEEEKTTTTIEGDTITTTNITSNTEVNIYKQDNGLKFNLTDYTLNVGKQNNTGTKFLNFTDTYGLKIQNKTYSPTQVVQITPISISVGTDINTETIIGENTIWVQNLNVRGAKADSGFQSLSVGASGSVYGKNLTVNDSASTSASTTKLEFVSKVTQDSEGQISVEKANITKIGETSTTLQGIAKVNSVGGTVGDAHARWINSTADSTGGKLYVGEVNTLIDRMVSNNEYHLIAEKEVDRDNWFKTGCFSDLITINSNGRVSASSFYATSDKRLKENIKPLNYDKSILDLPVYTYDYIDGQKNNIGCLAQDLQKLYPQLIGKNSNGYLTVDNSKVVYLLLEEVKKLKKELDEIKTKLK